jgi:hypothetical protein
MDLAARKALLDEVQRELDAMRPDLSTIDPHRLFHCLENLHVVVTRLALGSLGAPQELPSDERTTDVSRRPSSTGLSAVTSEIFDEARQRAGLTTDAPKK